MPPLGEAMYEDTPSVAPALDPREESLAVVAVLDTGDSLSLSDGAGDTHVPLCVAYVGVGDHIDQQRRTRGRPPGM